MATLSESEFNQKLEYVLQAVSKKNQFASKTLLVESVVIGVNAEHKFQETCIKANWIVKKADQKTDATKHYDFTIEFHNEKMEYHRQFRVDVKAQKKISRKDQKCSNTLLWVELIGYGQYNTGWINGSADLIAFELPTKFILIPRIALRDFIFERINPEIVYNPYNAIFRLYEPIGMKGVIMTLIPITSILPLMELCFEK